MVQAIQKNQVLDLLTTSFADNKRMLALLRSTHHKHLQIFFSYIYTLVEQCGEIFISTKASTVLLYFQHSKQRHSFKSILALSRFLLFSFSWKNLGKTRRINKVIKQTRNAYAASFGDEDFLYVWFVESLFSSLPIYIETTVPRMVAIYERAGFSFYAKEKCGNQIVWFGKYGGHGK